MFLTILVLVLFVAPLVSAEMFDWVGRITGRIASQTSEASVAVDGINAAQITYVSTITATTPNEGSFEPITFDVTMYDQDGVADLNDTSVSANFTKGSSLRESTTCTWIKDFDSYYANYSCTIDMWYWDENGDWDITVTGKDLGAETWVYNDTTTFQINLLRAMVIDVTSLTWTSLLPGASNQQPSNDPTTINNTGNYNATIKLTATDLYGETIDVTETINAANFTADETDGQACASGTALVNGTATTITGTIANRGNLSIGSGEGQEEVYYCIPNVPLVSSQTYSTTGFTSWTIEYPA